LKRPPQDLNLRSKCYMMAKKLRESKDSSHTP
jgi:hypothetical protein